MEKPITQPPKKKVWIETYGCQMNINDSEKMYRILNKLDYEPTSTAEKADLILLNTCTIREKAEQKVFSRLGRLKSLKENRPQLLIGVAGCLAQMLGEKLRQRAPFVDLVLGTYAIQKLPEMLNQVVMTSQGVTQVGKLMPNDFDFLPMTAAQPGDFTEKQSSVARHVTIQNGCNKNCSYCIVPTVRGREISRPVDDILQEIELLTAKGVREVMLVGQTVNSYGKGESPDFADLLRRINAFGSLARIRFITSHPRDLNQRLMLAMAESAKVCEHLHLPVQSGSNHVLRRMYRGYTAEQYLENINQLRQMVPGIAITTDFIVGFPGETEEDFAATLEILRAAQFENSFSFIYSPRPFTKAATWGDQIPLATSKDRLSRLQLLQDEITAQHVQGYLGKTVEVLVEGAADRKAAHRTHEQRALYGRTRNNWNVHFDGSEELIGQLVQAKVDRVLAHSLQGVLI